MTPIWFQITQFTQELVEFQNPDFPYYIHVQGQVMGSVLFIFLILVTAQRLKSGNQILDLALEIISCLVLIKDDLIMFAHG